MDLDCSTVISLVAMKNRETGGGCEVKEMREVGAMVASTIHLLGIGSCRSASLPANDYCTPDWM